VLFALMLAVFCVASCPGEASGQARTWCAASSDHRQAATIGGHTDIPVASRRDQAKTSGDLLRTLSRATRRIDFRRLVSGEPVTVSLNIRPRRGPPLHWLVYDRAAGGRFSHPSLQILFCSWLA
jgi:hypothetical protein